MSIVSHRTPSRNSTTSTRRGLVQNRVAGKRPETNSLADTNPPDEPQERRKSSIPFAGIVDIIEPLLKQRPSTGAVFLCPVCRLMCAGTSCRNEAHHDEILEAPPGPVGAVITAVMRSDS